MIADAAHFIDGIRQEDCALTLEEVRRRLGEGLVWLSLVEPSVEELAKASEGFGLHPIAIEQACDPDQRPKIQEFDDHLFLVVRTARHRDGEERVEFGEIHAFVGTSFVVVVRHGPTNTIKDALVQSEQRRPLGTSGAPATAWAILDKVINDYEPVLAGLARANSDVERAVFAGEADQTQRIYLLRRELAELSRAVHPLLAPLGAVERGDFMSLVGDLPVHFRALADHVRHLDEEVLAQLYQLEGVLQANLALIGVRQNDVVRKVSGWGAVITIATLIASVYGMNFEHMPELGWAFGYPFALTLMLTSAMLLWRLLRRVRWL